MAQQDFPKKYLDKIDPEFLDSVQAMETEDIKKRILEAEGNMYEIDKAKAADEELTKIREKAREIGAPYRESKSKEMAKIQYLLYTLEGRGIEL
jgi:hypothetical protein